MITITNLTNDALQLYKLTTEDGENIELQLNYLPFQELWSFDIKYKDLVINGVTLVVSANMLRNYQNIIPFGLACTSKDKGDPYFIEDFVSGRVKLHLLTSDEVMEVEDNIYGKI